MELRCANTMHGVLNEDHTVLEVKCRNNVCGARAGVVVLHRFDMRTGTLIDTQKFMDPRKEVNKRATDHHTAAVRTA